MKRPNIKKEIAEDMALDRRLYRDVEMRLCANYNLKPAVFRNMLCSIFAEATMGEGRVLADRILDINNKELHKALRRAKKRGIK